MPIVYQNQERQEGVANWFKQMGTANLEAPMEFKEGYYSIHDTMAETAKNQEAHIVSKAAKLMTNFDVKPNEGMWDMMKNVTPEVMGK